MSLFVVTVTPAVTLATALAATAVPMLVFIVAVKSPAVGALVRLVAVVAVVVVSVSTTPETLRLASIFGASSNRIAYTLVASGFVTQA